MKKDLDSWFVTGLSITFTLGVIWIGIFGESHDPTMVRWHLLGFILAGALLTYLLYRYEKRKFMAGINSEDNPPLPLSPPQSPKYYRNCIKQHQRTIDALNCNINTIAKEIIPDFHFMDYAESNWHVCFQIR